MTNEPPNALSPPTLLAEAGRVLEEADYRVERETGRVLSLPPDRALIAEDKYGVVVVVVYDTWRDLSHHWRDAQSAVVEALSARFLKLDPKAWEGYLLLLTSAFAVDGDSTVHDIRYDTSRIRKIVATGDDLQSLADVERALLPVLPLDPHIPSADEARSPLDELPRQLEEAGIQRELAEAALAAFRDRRPIVQALHEKMSTE